MYKVWIKTFFTVFLILLTIIVSINIVADPMLVLPFVHKLNNRTHHHNVAHQRTNMIFFQHYYKLKDYDGIIIGSSRTMPMDPNLFSPEYTVFNYSSRALRPEEFLSYLSFAQELHGKPLRLIVIGLDFFASSGVKTKSHVKGIPAVYTEEVKKPCYTIANLISVKAFRLAISVLKENISAKRASYWERKTGSEIEYSRPSPEVRKINFSNSLNTYKDTFSNFKYNSDYKQILEEIKNAFPNTEFMVFTTPVSKPHYDMMFEYGLGASYKRWLKDIVDVFGNVVHFMGENEVTLNHEKYFGDPNHLYPRDTDLITQRLLHKEYDNFPKDFGMVLTKENLPEYLKTIK